MQIRLKIIKISISLLLLARFYLLLSKKEISIDNAIEYGKQDNINFSEYKSTIKPIAIYNLKRDSTYDHIYYNKLNQNKVKHINFIQLYKQINLAKSHGIYGIAFY